MEDWIGRLPVELRESGVSLAAYGALETCFSGTDALRVVDVLIHDEGVCLGCNEWIQASEGLRPSFVGWHLRRFEDEPLDQMTERSWQEARDFIADRAGSDSCFTITVGPYRDPIPVDTSSPYPLE
jgi:hypothetical protein